MLTRKLGLGNADGEVRMISLQADGKIYVAGGFSTLSGGVCSQFGRLNPDGTLNAANPGVTFAVQSLAIQANGNILLAGASPNQVARLNGLCQMDTNFTLAADGAVYSLALQTNGGILLGGNFQQLGGQPRDRMARAFDENLPREILIYDGTNVTWLRYDASPMVWRTTFDVTYDGTNWLRLGPGIHVRNGEQVSAPALPPSARLRARGFIQGGFNTSSGWFEEATLPVSALLSPFTCATNGNALSITGYIGPENAVTIPSTIYGLPVTSIGQYAFEYYRDPLSVVVPDSVTSLEFGAFYNATGLKNITLPTGLKTIGDYAFRGCGGLAGILIPNTVTRIGDYAFWGAGIPNITIPDSVTYLGTRAFWDCACRTVSLGNGLTNLSPALFQDAGLSNVTIGTNVATIGMGAFASCWNLTQIVIPKAVTSIEDAAFTSCGNLTAVYFQGNAPSLGGTYVFSSATKAVIYYLPGTTGWGATFGGRPTRLWIP